MTILFHKIQEFVSHLAFLFTFILAGIIFCISLLNHLPPETKTQVAVEFAHRFVYGGYIFFFSSIYLLFFIVIIGPFILDLIKDLMGIKHD